MRILLIDNYDSFTFNLLHLIQEVCDAADSVDMVFNDRIDLTAISGYDVIIISPGPGVPKQAGKLLQVIKKLSPFKPILGICLGHQAIAESFGANICCLAKPLHGVQSDIRIIDHSGIFYGLKDKIVAGRYHSWMVEDKNLPDDLKVTAMDNEGNIMALSHRKYQVHGVQFHPESFMTPEGYNIVANFLNQSR